MTTEDHTDCLAFLIAKTAQIKATRGLDLLVASEPFTVAYPEFPAQQWTCPHGVPYWTQPTPAEAERLRAMNAEATR